MKERLEESLGKDLEKPEVERSKIDNEDILKSGWTNV